jgi:PKD domain/Calcineurin-like phosphoesterase
VLFGVYSEALKNTHLWSTFGNHEGFSSVSLAQVGPYYDAFTFPKAGEAGGAPSGTEAYYSFDYANIHFICLNSHDIPRQEFGAMMTWLKADLAQNKQKWTIAYWHHPPYSRGSHNSDGTGDTPESAPSIREMREIAVPILEEAGVDLVLNGHSHTYERSFLLDGHYGTSNTLTDGMKIDGGDGREEGDGAYRKTPDVTADSHAGTVYTVAASAGDARTGSLDHPVMVSSFGNVNGSVVIDISGDRLDLRLIDSAANPVHDHFTIIKSFAQGPTAPTLLPIADDAFPDQSGGVDRDGKYRLSWTYPALPAEQPCGYEIEESNPSGSVFSDAAEEALDGGSNSKWTSNGDWVSTPHPGTLTNGYTVVYTVDQNSPLTMVNPVMIPDGHSARLSFRSYEDIEQDFDFGHVEVSADGGPFETLATYTGVFSGERAVDLSAYAGQTITLRFRFTSDFITLTGQLGWFIDDINIQTSNWTQIATTTATSYDITGRGNGTYLYRVNGVFGDCAAGGTAGDYSNLEQITVELGPPTINPTASFTAAPNPAETNQSITFDASGSHDNDMSGPPPEIRTYFWTFGDGTTETTSSPITTHSYSAAGAYRVLLMITDNEGETAETEAFVQVNESQPAEIHISGAGFIMLSGQKANFAFEAAKEGPSSSGNLTYHDRNPNLKVRSLAVTSVQRFGNRAVFSGTCTLNKQPGFTFTVTVEDGGPGSSDTFRINLSNGYEASGTLAGGNIQFD